MKGLRTFVISMLAMFLAFLSPLANAAEAIGQVISLTGTAEVVRATDETQQPLKFRDSIFLNDRIITAARSQVRLLLKDDSVIKVSPKSELLVNELVVGPADQSRTTVKLLKGKLRSFVGKRLGANARFEVHTSVAVAGVRGTDFEVLTYNPTFVRCFEGQVRVDNIQEAITDFVILGANTFTQIMAGQPPTPPQHIPPTENLYRKTGRAEQGDEEAEEDEKADEDLSSDESGQVEDKLEEGGQAFTPDFDQSLLGDVQGAGPSPSDLLQDQLLYGDSHQEQLDTIIDSPVPGIAVPIQIDIPSP